MTKPRVAILTSFSDMSPGYSLTTVVQNTARMLARGGYDYRVLALKYFNAADAARVRADGINLDTVLAKVPLHDYQTSEGPRPEFEEQVEQIHGGIKDGENAGIGYEEALRDFDVVLDEDLMFLSWYLPANAALRRVMEAHPGKRYLHRCHSGASGPHDCPYPSSLRYQGAPGQYVFLNETNAQDLANTMRIGRDQVSVVYNVTDPRDFYGFQRETRELIDAHALMDHDILQVYPFSTPRWEAKGVRQILAIFGAWKRMGLRAKLVLVNAHCTQECDWKHVRAIEEYARRCGLFPGVDLVITSRVHEQRRATADAPRYKDWDYNVPAVVVRDLTILSNVFLFPTASECCSLIQSEASVSGKFLLVNENFLALREFCHDTVLHYRFSQENPDKNPGYYNAVAREAYHDMSRNPIFMNTTRARTRTYNADWVMRNQLEPLLFVGFDRKEETKS